MDTMCTKVVIKISKTNTFRWNIYIKLWTELIYFTYFCTEAIQDVILYFPHNENCLFNSANS